jgi:hypothetical protein
MAIQQGQPADPATGNPGQASGEGAKGAGSFATNLVQETAGSGSKAPALQDGAQGDKSSSAQGQGDTSTGDLPGWTSAVTKDLRADPRFAAFAGKFKEGKLDDVVKSAMDAEAKMGTMAAIPNEKSTPEERAAFYTKLGVPEKPEGYKLEKQPDLTYDEGQIKEFQTMAHKLGLSNDQANAMFKEINGRAQKALQDYQTRTDEARVAIETGLKTEWGQKYDENLQVVTRGLKAFAPKDLLADAEATGMGNRKSFIQLFHKLGLTVKEDSAIHPMGAAKGSGKSTAEIFYPGKK